MKYNCYLITQYVLTDSPTLNKTSPRYGSGYTATIKTGNVGVLIARLEEELTTPTLLEHHHNMVIYAIPQHSSLAPLFSVLSRLRKVCLSALVLICLTIILHPGD